jgi:hypothetical protein
MSTLDQPEGREDSPEATKAAHDAAQEHSKENATQTRARIGELKISQAVTIQEVLQPKMGLVQGAEEIMTVTIAQYRQEIAQGSSRADELIVRIAVMTVLKKKKTLRPNDYIELCTHVPEHTGKDLKTIPQGDAIEYMEEIFKKLKRSNVIAPVKD